MHHNDRPGLQRTHRRRDRVLRVKQCCAMLGHLLNSRGLSVHHQCKLILPLAELFSTSTHQKQSVLTKRTGLSLPKAGFPLFGRPMLAMGTSGCLRLREDLQIQELRSLVVAHEHAL